MATGAAVAAATLALRSVADYAIGTDAFDAVPEPASWALMILGFGMSGALLRRRSRRGRLPA